jgi:hypothetical protein
MQTTKIPRTDMSARAQLTAYRIERTAELHRKGLTVPQIAERLNCDKNSVRGYLLRLGLKANPVEHLGYLEMRGKKVAGIPSGRPSKLNFQGPSVWSGKPE